MFNDTCFRILLELSRLEIKDAANVQQEWAEGARSLFELKSMITSENAHIDMRREQTQNLLAVQVQRHPALDTVQPLRHALTKFKQCI